MVLSQLNKKDKAKVIQIEGTEEFINRLASFGVVEESELQVVQFTLAKNTMEINSDGTSIALRLNEAKQIHIQKLN